MALGVGDFISFLCDAGYGFVVICYQTNFSLRVSSPLGVRRGRGGGVAGVWGREKSRESSTLAPSLAIHGEFASRLNVLKWSSGCLNAIANYLIAFIYEIFGPGKTSKSCFRRQFWRTAYKADRDHAGQTFFTVILKVPGLPSIWFHLRSFLSFCFCSCIPSLFLIFVPESGHWHNFLNFFL